MRLRLSLPDDSHAQDDFIGKAQLLFLAGGALCLVTSWGMKRGRRWSRASGLCACALLLPGVPLLTLLALVGMYVLLARWKTLRPAEQPTAIKPSKDYWVRKKKSPAQGIAVTVCAALGWIAFAKVRAHAEALGLPAWHPGWLGVVYFFVVRLAMVAIHELGHAVMTWALFGRCRVISIGPFVFSNIGHGNQFQFHWQGMFSLGGFVAPSILTGERLRSKTTLVIAAGPTASLLCGLVMLPLCFLLPGSSIQNYWWIAACLGMMGLTDAVSNLLPLGYSDGSMLFHMIFWTRPGQQLLSNYSVMQMHEDAEVLHNRADFENELRLRETALQRALDAGEDNTIAIALSHEALGEAKLASGDWLGAEVEIRKCLAFEAECALESGLPAYGWSGVQKASVARHHVAEVGRAYACAVPVMEKRIQTPDHVGPALKRYRLAEVHTRAGNFTRALAEIAETLRIIPADRDRLVLRANLYALEAQCKLGNASGLPSGSEPGLASARCAAEIVRSREIPAERQNRAWDELGHLGDALWQSGQSAMAVDLLREAIQELESAGAKTAAVQHRIKLAGVLRELGNPEEAWECLAVANPILPCSRRTVLMEKVRLLLLDRADEAISNCRELLSLWQSEPSAEAEIAVTEGVLAEALLESGDYPQAEAMARQAADVLRPWQHCEAASCLITLAIAQWHNTGGSTRPLVDEALRVIESDPLLSLAAKSRLRERQGARLARHAFPEESLVPEESIASALSMMVLVAG